VGGIYAIAGGELFCLPPNINPNGKVTMADERLPTAMSANPKSKKGKKRKLLIIISSVVGVVVLFLVGAFLMYKQPWVHIKYTYNVGFLGKLSATKITIPVDSFYRIKVDMHQGQTGTLDCTVKGDQDTTHYKLEFSNSQMTDEDSDLLNKGDYTLSCEYNIASSTDSAYWITGPAIEYTLTLERE